MNTIFQLNESELNVQFMNAIKLLFKNKHLTLTIESDDVDTTSHLLSNITNRERLLESIKNINEGQHLREVNISELKAMTTDA